MADYRRPLAIRLFTMVKDNPQEHLFTGSTIVAANDFGDLGNLALTNNIAFFMSPEISVGAEQIILAYADHTVISPVQDGITPDPAKITFWRSEDETEATALALANKNKGRLSSFPLIYLKIGRIFIGNKKL
jgi:hypothetical protein